MRFGALLWALPGVKLRFEQMNLEVLFNKFLGPFFFSLFNHRQLAKSQLLVFVAAPLVVAAVACYAVLSENLCRALENL